MIALTIALGLSLLLLLILHEEWRKLIRKARLDVQAAFSHAHQVYPHAKPFSHPPGKYLPRPIS